MLETTLGMLGLAADRCVMIGDRLSTDIAMAAAAGMDSALVLTGETTPEMAAELAPDAAPTWVLDRIDGLLPEGASLAEYGTRDQLRLMTVASRLYHERGVRQRDIATQLGVSQPRVSRLLQQAEEQGIVRTVVVAPEGIYPEPEEALEDAYKLRECHVVEVFGGEERSRGSWASRPPAT